jgi:hypothetical protein
VHDLDGLRQAGGDAPTTELEGVKQRRRELADERVT